MQVMIDREFAELRSGLQLSKRDQLDACLVEGISNLMICQQCQLGTPHLVVIRDAGKFLVWQCGMAHQFEGLGCGI